jgi:hypothetical protein
MTLPCPRCGAKNSDEAARCYACAAHLDAPQPAPDDIPDALLEQAERELREEPPVPRDSTDRLTVAVAGTAGLCILFFLLPLLAFWFSGGLLWIIVAASPLLVFICYCGLVLIAFAALWAWALNPWRE